MSRPALPLPAAARTDGPRPHPRAARALTTAIGLATAALLAVVGLAPGAASAASSPAAPVGDRLTTGQVLPSGASLAAASGAHVLSVGTDGDVTVRLGTGPVLWHTGTTGNPGARLVQQPAGALEVRSVTGALLWTTGVQSPGARSIIKPDGVLYTIDTAGRLAWRSTTDGPALRTTGTDRVPSGGLLLAGESIASGDVRLTMGADGDLTLARGGAVVWRTGTAARGAVARMTTGGELQVAADGAVLWSSGTSSAGARLVVKDHARIYVVATSGAGVWSSPAPVAERVPAVVSLPLPAALPVVTRPGTGTGAAPSGGSSVDGGAAGERVYRTVLSGAPQYAEPTSEIARAATAARAEGRTDDAALLEQAATGGAARWLGPADGTSAVRAYTAAATAAGRTPVLVTYAVPDRDCGSYSAGGFTSHTEYRAWADAVAAGLRGSRAVVVVEPDALLHLERCGDRDQRLASLRYSVDAYVAAGAEVYIDAASSNSYGWSADQLREMALRLRAAGVDRAAGFSVNVSNFQRSEHEVAYGTYLSALLGGPAFVVDTSRNGNGPLAGPEGTVWCNPEGRALGARPAATGAGPHVADLWIKTVGRSDGTCNGGPVAGTYWEEYVLGLAARATPAAG
jgi:endoglucanase